MTKPATTPALPHGPNDGSGRLFCKPPVKFDDGRKKQFLDAFRKCGHQARSAVAAGISVRIVQAHLHKDPEFAAAYVDAYDEYKALLAQQIQTRLPNSDRILMFETKRHMPEYRESFKVEKTVEQRVTHEHMMINPRFQQMMQDMTPEERHHLRELARLQQERVNQQPTVTDAQTAQLDAPSELADTAQAGPAMHGAGSADTDQPD